jgi:hypothetical protein
MGDAIKQFGGTLGHAIKQKQNVIICKLKFTVFLLSQIAHLINIISDLLSKVKSVSFYP